MQTTPLPRRFRPSVLALGATCALLALTCGPQMSTPEDGGPALPFLAPAPAAANPAALNGNLTVLSDVAEAVLPAVVNIRATKVARGHGGPFFDDPFFRRFFGQRGDEQKEQRSLSRGSGVLVGADGLVLTNNHVVSDSDEVVVALSDGREFPAELVGTDPRSDLAVIRLQGAPTDLVALELGSSEAMRLGEVVLAVGNPFGLEGTVTMGIVSAKGRSDVGIVDYEDFIQTDAAINPGNSGGALVNTRGELVGINTAILSGTGGSQGVGFSIPTDLARPIMQSLLDNGRVDRGWLGVYIRDATPAAYDFQKLRLPEDLRGVFVDGFAEGSPAAVAGLRKGDVIIQVDGRATSTSSRLRNTVAHMPAGHTVDLDLMRMGKRMTVSVPLDPLPDEVPERGSRSRR